MITMQKNIVEKCGRQKEHAILLVGFDLGAWKSEKILVTFTKLPYVPKFDLIGQLVL